MMDSNPLHRPDRLRRLWLLCGMATVLASTATPALAAAPKVGGQAPGYFRLALGDFEVTALSDGAVELPVDQLLLHTTPKAVQKTLQSQYLKAPLATSVNAYLVNTGDKLVLIDAGAGSLFGPSLGQLVDNLQAAGYRPEQVDEIYITHLHPDHVGGLAAQGQRVFTNAVVRVEQRDADYWLSKDQMDKAGADAKGFFQGAMQSLQPYVDAGKFQPFSGNAELLPGIRATVTQGHTVGHSTYTVESAGQRMVVWGDLIHVAAVQFAQPQIAIKFDSDSPTAVTQRKKAFTAAARDGVLAAGAHLAFPGLGHVRAQRSGYVWLPLNYPGRALAKP